MLNPGEPFPVEGAVSSTGATPTSSSSSRSTSASTTDTPGVSASSSHKSFPAGAIAGIVIGAILIVALAAALFFYIGRTKTLKESVNRQSLAPAMLGFSGQMSPAAPPPEPQMYQSGGTVYVPVKASDLHRASLPPYGQSGIPDTHSPVHGSTGGSPGPQYTSVSHYEVGQQQQHLQQDHQRFVLR
jgi:hypothetical protein